MMKRVLKLVTAITLIAVTLQSSFIYASTEIPINQLKNAEICLELGLILGDGTGVDVSYLSSDAERLQAAVIMLRLMGLEEDMLQFDYEGETTFKDIPQSDYEARLLSYLHNHPELGWVGDEDGYFNSYQLLSAKELTKVLLETLKYKQGLDFTWESVFDFAHNKGFARLDSYSGRTLQVIDVCGFIIDVLTKINKDEVLLIDKLIDANVVDKNIAEFYGLIRADLKIDYVDTISNTLIRLYFNVQIDEIDENQITVEGLHVLGAYLNEGGMTADVSISSGEVGERYEVTVSGAKFAGDHEVDASTTFTYMGRDVYGLNIEFIGAGSSLPVIESDGHAAAMAVITMQDIDGLALDYDSEVELEFSSSFGTFAEARVTMQDGVASNLLVSEFLPREQYATVRATVIEAEDERLIGMRATTYILMTPFIEDYREAFAEPNFMMAEANEADRIIAVFDRPIDVEDITLTEDEMLQQGVLSNIDSSVFDITVRKDSTSFTSGSEVTVLGIEPLYNKDGIVISNVIQILLDIDNVIDDNGSGVGDPITESWLTDNSDVFITMTNRSKGQGKSATATFKFTDVRIPTMLSVEKLSSYEYLIEFSEAIINQSIVGAEGGNAELLNNWSIDGLLLSTDAMNATVEVKDYNAATGIDERHKVLITLGTDIYGNQIFIGPGRHSIQATRIGDWAYIGDKANEMATQTLDFSIPEDYMMPMPSIEVQSPEQILLTFNTLLNETISEVADAIHIQRYDSSIENWVDIEVRETINDNNTVDYVIEEIPNQPTSTYLLQLDLDWSVYYETSSSHENYFINDFRLLIPKETLSNRYNGLENHVISLPIEGYMTEVDAKSPYILKTQTNPVDSNLVDIYLSEPVKISSLLNSESATVSQEQGYLYSDSIVGQASWEKLPRPSVEFMYHDQSEVIKGNIVGIDSYDQVITIEPDSELSLGDWNVILRSISDDIGNTTASTSHTYVKREEVVAFDIEFAYADVDEDMVVEDVDDIDNETAKDFIYIKFTRPISISGDFKNVLKTSNYTLDGAELPSGSQIIADITYYDFYDDVTDSITIVLPQGTLEGKNAPHDINIAQTIESVSGQPLGINGGEIILPYTGVDLSNAHPDYDTLAEQIDKSQVVDFFCNMTRLDYEDMIASNYSWNELATFSVMAYDTLQNLIALDDSAIFKEDAIAYIEGILDETRSIAIAENYFTLDQGATQTQVVAICGSDLALETNFTVIGSDFNFLSTSIGGSSVVMETPSTGTLGAALTLGGDGSDDEVIVTIQFIPLGVESSIKVIVTDPSLLGDDVVVDPNNSYDTDIMN